MKRIFCYAVLCAAFFITGCTKELSEENGFAPGSFTGGTGTTNNTSLTLLKTYVLLEGTDTLEKHNYTYDNLGRSIRNDEFEYFGNVAKFRYTLFISYDTNDTLQSRVLYYSYDLVNNTVDSAKEFFFYDGSRRVIKDSITENTNTPMVYYYDFLPGYINMTTNFNESLHIYQTLSGGNITSEQDSVFVSGLYDSRATLTGSYDTHPNPFSRTELKRNVWFNVENAEQDYSKFPKKNNPADDTYFWPANGSDVHYTYSYTYNAAGYPTLVTLHDVVNNYIQTGIYIYQ